jgi:hypothetical protein
MPRTTESGRAWLLLIAVAAVASGCATGNARVLTEHYTLTHPDFWKVKKTAERDGEATVVVIPQYGSAVIDEGTGTMAAKDQNYDAVTADVEVRLYAWSDPDSNAPNPTDQVSRLLMNDQDLALGRHHMIADNPPECGIYPKKYVVFGVQQTPYDLVSRPGWRTILVGAKTAGVLVGAVARVDYEQDPARSCHNLANMRVQLQNLLDGMQPAGGTAPQAKQTSAPAPAASPVAPASAAQ